MTSTETAGDHFPSFDDRIRASSKSAARSGRLSPTHSAHGNLYTRSSVMSFASDMKAKKVRFYRNGDRFFRGMIYAVSPERFRTFDALMAELTSSPLGDKTVLPQGVRHIFSLDGSRKIVDIDHIRDGESYVCASTQAFKRMDYPRSATPTWAAAVNSSPNLTRADLTSSVNTEDGEDRDYITPRLVTVVRNGTKPRKAVRILLNKKTAHNFQQVMNDITSTIKLDTGAVRKLFTLGGKQITCLRDFFGEESMFIAYGNEKYALDDFDSTNPCTRTEVKFSSAYKCVRQRERITLKSPKMPRRMPMSASSSSNSLLSESLRSKTPKSPASARRRLGSASSKVKVIAAPATPTFPRELSLKYQIGQIIGEGNFATVKECIEKSRKKMFALKIIDKTKCKGKEEMIDNEVQILRKVKHENVIGLMEEYESESCLYLVMEMITGGDLFDAISSSTKYTERDASGMLYNLACAIKYLHSLSIVHRDVKPENILICEHPDGTLSLKLGDFGLATVVHEPLYTVCGTPTYISPEVLTENGYGLKVDVWATGVITYILLCGFPPFVSVENNHDELFDKIMSGKFTFPSPFWDDVSESAKELIQHMLQVDHDDRFTAAEVLEHPWVADDLAKDCDLHSTISKGMAENAMPRKARKSNPGVELITSTALDTGSRYFSGRKAAPLQELDSNDEVF
ncbi:hypothetical protein CAPTEDRAFT_228781 [Capitella teleta]|uniref:non-specific serine/threonine protein kinase n=1 Tax=Capitella teleta TaxID=283909 RepID=R7TDG1_CAPTE|nr:hypothetical protein CAPTEDRAFT_228781 [Capitella teleta]|eukprot:ELT89101.1 hypothetical protein CAPTEDRAFT_228781 [Capitella teleta]